MLKNAAISLKHNQNWCKIIAGTCLVTRLEAHCFLFSREECLGPFLSPIPFATQSDIWVAPTHHSTVTLGLQGLTNSPVLIHIHGHITDHIVTGFAEKAVWVTPPSQQALMNDPMQVHAYEYWSGHATWSGAWPCSTSQCFFDSRWCCLLFLTSRRLRSKGTNAS